ncbi:acyl-CoA dehydrogenase [Methylocystis sp. MJC1]|jgi:alkylation response protein AidB-like acyl-CoA dehydrogenase|uniref:acyl-CoA dehydrogenase n=1 Tax=Methylocystis sp. MJC1 TaxID=2654282 RepID=UPI0013EA68FD|nr:acyl-CoA dehydrogenase [Methylocystis sp. MJC1]KAF2990910.1 3-methylmercaptopropionyl-CoA dehydrogenase [Methylocystis sp. MJC1]MBU6527804.1 acyl-CoA dehydrogenase [Methylocystis sp. MJC1]UZX10732.1 acyl-CoA dehydrogenase [Methylocystis sp. MJC1]
MTYRAPLSDILFSLRLAAGPDAEALYADIADGVAEQTLNEAAKFAEGQLLPLDRIGDRAGVKFSDGAVTTAPGWREAYAGWREGGWNAIAANPDHGGLGLPALLNAACTEIWNAANISFALCPLLSHGAIEALEAHASAALKETYLAKIVSGEWTGTMNLTEPQAGSDLALLRTRAERNADGSYRLTGQKIFITYGEHDLADNIAHLVLARLPDAPSGTKGISLFLAPKFLPDETGAFTRRNALHCAGVEHKLGIHASPTCTMVYEDAVGFLIGEENNGLACMFTMMNNARLSVGLQGVALAERATQAALAYAKERKQGRAPGAPETSAIIEHPDVARMLLTMASLTTAARLICFETAASLDRAHRDENAAHAREAEERASLLTPVAKAFSTDIGNEVTSLAVQVHGGMGYIEETGVAQLMRDARICAIYEGTNGIQAIDLVGRKLPMSGGAALNREIADMRAISQESNDVAVYEAVEAFAQASNHLAQAMKEAPAEALAGATPYLRLFALARGATLLEKAAKAARRGNDHNAARYEALAHFFAKNIAVAAPGLAKAVMEGARSVTEGRAAFAG